MFQQLTYYNKYSKQLSLNDVAYRILTFIKENPSAVYVLSLGSDSQVHSGYTSLVNAICISRVGDEAWFAITKQYVGRELKNLREKISMETALTYTVYNEMTEMLIDPIEVLMMEFPKLTVEIQAHIDVGRYGKTKALIKEMTGYFEGTLLKPVIKPDSYCASAIANRFTKEKIRIGA